MSDPRGEDGPTADFVASLSRQILGCSTDLQVITQVLGETWATSAPVPPELLTYLYRVTRELRRLGYVTLSLSQSLDSKKPFSLAPLNMELVVEDMAKSFQTPGSKVRLVTRPLAKNPWVWWGEVEQLRMVLDSLIDPLLRYAKPNSQLIIALEDYHGQLERGNGYLLVSATGTEAIIQPAQTSQLFDNLSRDLSFKQLNNGLSLYLARRLIERHGGQLEAENGSKGSLTFWFTLPLVDNSEGGR